MMERPSTGNKKKDDDIDIDDIIDVIAEKKGIDVKKQEQPRERRAVTSDARGSGMSYGLGK